MKRSKKRRDVRREEKFEERSRRVGRSRITGGITGFWDWMAGHRTSSASVGRRNTTGAVDSGSLETKLSINGTRDSDIGTTRGTGIQEAHRMVSGDGMVASTPGSEALKWIHWGQFNRYSPIREGRSWLSPPRKSKTPELDTGRILM